MKKLTRIWLICMVALIVVTVALFYGIAERTGFITGDWPTITIFVEVILGVLVYCWFVSRLKETIKKERERAIWIFSIIIIVTAGLIILLLIDKIDVGQLIEILVLLGLVLITAEYAKEIREQRYNTVLPIIDIERQAEGQELIGEGVAAKSEDFSYGVWCILRNIGVGPAVDVYSFIINPIDDKPQRWAFGTLGTEKHTPKMRFFPERRGDRRVLVAYYKDVHGRDIESSREVSVDKERGGWNTGPLKTEVRKIAKEELP